MRALALAILVVLVAPSALAQLALIQPTISVFATDPGKAFTPGAREPVVVVVTYQPGNGGRPTPAPTPDRPEGTAPTRVTLAAKTLPSWVTDITFDPPEILIRMGIENSTRATYSEPATAYLNISPDAPALQREDLVVTATAEPNGNLQGRSAESPPLKLRATTIGKLNVSAEASAPIAGGRWSDVTFQVRNEGNSDIVAKINVTVRPESSQVEFTDTLQLKRGETLPAVVRIRTPWTNAEFGTLELEATPIVEGEEGNAARAEVDVRGASAVPGAPVGALLALLVLAAIARRR